MTMSEGLSPVSCSLPCFPEEEKEIVKELIRASEANLKEGDVFCLISSRWWREWKEYVRFDVNMGHSNFSKKQKEGLLHTCRPGQIDNSELILNGMNSGDFLDLHGNLLEGEDYDLVPLEVWKKLVEWYRGGPEIPRKLLSEGFYSKNFSVEVYPLCLCLIDARDNSERTIRISRKASVGELYKMVCTLFELDQAKVIIWDYFKKNKSSMLTKMDQSLDEATLHMDQEILLEVQLDGLWPSNFGMDSTGNEMALVPIEPSRSSMSIAGGPTISNGHSTRLGSYFLQGNNFSSSQRDSEDVDDILCNETKVDGRGLTGLHNLGNTCFMNSAIQCLVHTSPLLEFFLQDYSEEINKKNPLGMQGELAIAFGELLRALWSSGRSSVAPRAFKGKLARFAPQFSGYNQHDSQELLAFLLDGLHEDLNRVRNKPYIEAKDANGRLDEEFADECWEYHRARNDSVIVDICQGQYKSTLVCPVCRKVSVTFDPFMYLSLPMPSAIMRKMTVTVFSGDGSALPMPYTVTVSKNGCCRDLVQALSTACCLKSYEALLIAEVHEHQIHRYIENMFEPLSGIKDDDYLVAYRLPSNYNKLGRIDIFHRNVERCAPELLYSFSRKLLGTPLVTCLPEGANSGADIHVAVRTVLTPLLRAKALLPSHQAKTISMNGCGPSLDAIALTDNHTLPNGKDLPASNMDIEPTANRSPSFQLSMTDQRGISGIAIRDNNTFLAPESSIKLFLDWSQREHELYDASYLEDLPGVHHSGNKKTRQEPVSLFSCLDAFLKEEPLGPEDMWYCPACKEHRQATKKLDLWRLPEILVVHLKRFSYNRFMKNKLETFVNFPVHNLDLTKYVKKPSTTESHLYELYAISNHYGGLGGGHYTAYAKLIDQGRWYHFDDSHVSPVGEESIKTSAAYVLFYQRVK